VSAVEEMLRGVRELGTHRRVPSDGERHAAILTYHTLFCVGSFFRFKMRRLDPNIKAVFLVMTGAAEFCRLVEIRFLRFVRRRHHAVAGTVFHPSGLRDKIEIERRISFESRHRVTDIARD